MSIHVVAARVTLTIKGVPELCAVRGEVDSYGGDYEHNWWKPLANIESVRRLRDGRDVTKDVFADREADREAARALVMVACHRSCAIAIPY